MIKNIGAGELDELAVYSDVVLFDMIENETDPDTLQLLRNEAHWRANAFAASQEAN